MAIYNVLSEIQDERKGKSDCAFNGYLEDYLEDIDDEKLKEELSSLLDLDNKMRLIVNCRFNLNKDSLSNKIIRYRDIDKCDDGRLIAPYIFYYRQGEDNKVIIAHENILYAKGLYFAITDKDSLLSVYKNDISVIELYSDPLKDVYNLLKNNRPGYVQRKIDKRHFKTYDQLWEMAKGLSKDLGEDVANKANMANDKECYIKSRVERWYLLKKCVYVQYMVDKDILNNVHKGDIKAQRGKAKENADSIKFVSISEMWKGKAKGE